MLDYFRKVKFDKNYLLGLRRNGPLLKEKGMHVNIKKGDGCQTGIFDLSIGYLYVRVVCSIYNPKITTGFVLDMKRWKLDE